ncbi:MICOS complex subunit MIC26-like [Echeneis naucrates]|uniref:MICOS complex subunit MIC26-like n=1 Tax=Echeneis naucrates TaxID=173247 RepID=UPI00111374F5|nr:MICOS complex subunit MIC26-like [Echeneis naucrates]
MLKVTGRVMPGAPSLLPITVFAAAGDGKEEPTARVSLDELSLYTAPRQRESRYAAPEAGQLERSVATVRSLAEPYTSWFRVTYDKIKPKVQSVVQSGTDTYDYLKNPPKDFYPRAGVIGFTGVLGLVLARGSRMKKLVYPTVLLAVSSSLYYPEQAAAAVKSGGASVYECAVQGCAALERMLKPQSSSDKADPKP